MTRHGPLLAALAALALTPLRGGAQEKAPFAATGELRLHGSGAGAGAVASSAAYDDRRVIGPSVNLTRVENGAWRGGLAGEDVDLSIDAQRILGANVHLVLTRQGDRTSVEGLFFNRRFRVTLDARRLEGRFGACSFDLVRRGAAYEGDLGCVPERARFAETSRATLSLLGTAAEPSPPLPQLALSLVAVLPSRIPGGVGIRSRAESRR